MKFINTVTATHYIRSMPNSSTNALLVICDDGKESVLKHCGFQTEYGTSILIAEYLSYLVAQRFNLPVPEHCFIKIGKNFLRTIENEDIYRMLQASPEQCIGSVYIHGTLPFSDMINLKNRSRRVLLKTIFGFDQYLYNSDRFSDNPNLLFIPQSMELIVIDHSLAIWPILDYEETLDAPTRNHKEHVLYPYAKGDLSYVASLISEIYDVTIRYFIDTIPEGWLNEDMNKDFLTEFLKIRRDEIGNILKGVQKCRKKTTSTNLNLF